MKVLALIPAKGYSRRIPNKNLRLLGGKPLVAWTIEAALAAAMVTRVVVSTESKEVAAVARHLGAEVLDRPPHLAEDPAQAQDVAVHAMIEFADYAADVVVMLLPTSPFRTAAHIDDAVDWHLWDDHHRNVVSVISRPEMYAKLHSTLDGSLARIEAPVIVELNGAIWVSTPERVRTDGGFRTEGARAYPMRREAGLDIDWPLDWMVAEALLAEQAVPA